MDEVSQPRRWPWLSRWLTILFAIVALSAFAYVVWRGFAAESGERPAPLFGEVAMLEQNGRQRPFRLVAFADLPSLRPGDLIIREGEPAAVVWRVVRRDSRRLQLERQVAGKTERQEIALPPGGEVPRYVLLKPAPAP